MSENEEKVTSVPNCQQRLCDLVARNLDSGKFGLDVATWDVVWGTFQVQDPKTEVVVQTTGYGLIIAARGRPLHGAVLLGVELPLQANVHVLNGLLPTEDEIKEAIKVSYEGIRTAIMKANSAANGQAAGPIPPR
jgi:hypothetical protein